MKRIVFGGHSLGGREAIRNANKGWFPHIKGAFAYGARLPVPSESDGSGEASKTLGMASTLLMGGSKDGIMLRSQGGDNAEWDTPMEPVRCSFRYSFEENRPGYCLEVEGANHYAVVDPVDSTLGSFVRDQETMVSKAKAQDLIGDVVSLFVREVAFGDAEAKEELLKLVQSNHTLIKSAEWRR